MSHDLPPDLAKKVAEHAFDAYREKYADYHPKLTWVSDTRADASFRAKGILLTGSIELLPNEIVFEMKVPIVLRIFEKRALEIMQRELAFWVDQAKAGDIQ